MNHFKTFLLMFGLLALMMLVGQVIGGNQGMVSFFVMGLIMNFISYWFSDKIVLLMSGAKPVEEKELPQVYKIVRKLTLSQNLPMPKIYLMQSPVPNAFATGRNPEHAAVAVTTGIMSILDEKELTGVLGHELAHVKNRDILISTIAAAIAGAIMMASRMFMWFGMFGGHGSDDRENRSNGIVMLLIAILAPIAAMIIQMAISRAREYAADEGGSEITQLPLSLASALKKLQSGVQRNPQEISPATAHLYIVSPLSGGSLLTLFSTHPPIPERVKRLEALASKINPGILPNNQKIVY
ncbi:MAG: zinc metalloprotease HtpX [Elusimicrobia bacterium]|nr:zinc metalloprotease HtpX [Elusimicrobiota bacterium]